MTGLYLEHYGVKGMKWGKAKKTPFINNAVRSVSVGLQNNAGRNMYSGVAKGLSESQNFKDLGEKAPAAAQYYVNRVAYQRKIIDTKKEMDKIIADSNKKLSELRVKSAGEMAIRKLFGKTINKKKKTSIALVASKEYQRMLESNRKK